MNTLYTPFSRLSKQQQFKVGLEILLGQAQIIFSKKFAWFVGGIFGYFVIAYIINYNLELDDRMAAAEVLIWLLELPLIVLAIFMSMQLLSAEKDNRTLELLFTTSGSRYRVWLLRLCTLNGLLLSFAWLLAILSFFSVADLEIMKMTCNGFMPPFVIGALTFYFSIKFKSSFGAAMVSALITVLLLIFHGIASDESVITKYDLFFSPWSLPRGVDPETATIWMWQNRVVFVFLGLGLQFLGIRGLERRERLLS